MSDEHDLSTAFFEAPNVELSRASCMDSIACLDEADVLAFVAGALSGEALVMIDAHLDTCRACRLLVTAFATQTGGLSRDRAPLRAFEQNERVADRYRIVRWLGAGGMGEVYEAEDLVLGDTVALKTIRLGAAVDETANARIKAEVQLARRITHRNVCRVFDVGFHVEDGAASASPSATCIPFLTMELVAGETLGQRLRRLGPRPPSEVLSTLEQIAAGLDAAHEAGVLHTDLKTDNVMLVTDGTSTRVVITDFGLATQMGERPWLLAGVPAVAGTLGYMAPEQFAAGKTECATDIYAFGVICFELLMGHLPFTAQSLAAAAKESTWPLPERLPELAGVPSGWGDVIGRCLEPVPAHRFASAGQAVATLRASFAESEQAERKGSGAFSRVMPIAAILVGAAISFAAYFATQGHVTAPASAMPALSRPVPNVTPHASAPLSAVAFAVSTALRATSPVSVAGSTASTAPSVAPTPSELTPKKRIGSANVLAKTNRFKPHATERTGANAAPRPPQSAQAPGENDLIEPARWR